MIEPNHTIKQTADYSIDYITPTYPEHVYLNQIATSAEEQSEFTTIEIKDVIRNDPPTTLSKCLTTCKTIPGKIWYGIDKLAEGVASFFGITDSRYEMYIDDSIEYLANEEHREYSQAEAEALRRALEEKNNKKVFDSFLRAHRPFLLNHHMLRIPYKKPDQLSFESALKKAITTVFEEDPAAYEEDIKSLDSLRMSIQVPQDHEASINHHLAYYAQLNYLQSKFNFSETDVNVVFTWSNAFNQFDSVSSHNIGFEKASLIFNLGAIYNHLGQETGYEDDEAMKRGALYYQKSAGCFQSIIDNLINWEIFGSPNSQIGALANLMLGQAQEVFMKKAVAGNMKSITLAKLAMQVSTFHNCAYETALTTDTFDQSWLSHMQAKHLFYLGVASYYKSLDSEQTGKYGEQVGWLNQSAEFLKSATSKNILKNLPIDAFGEDMKKFQQTVTTVLASATKDNDKIYMETVPKVSDFPILQPARMVNPILIPTLSELQHINPLFRNLVQLKVHLALSKYSSKKDKMIKQLLDSMQESTNVAISTLSSMNLPGSIEALEQPIGLPSHVLDRSNEVRGKGGSRYLTNSWETISHLSSTDQKVLKEIIDTLNAEELEDQELKRIHQNLWTRTPSEVLTKKFREKANQYSENIKQADAANLIVEKKINTNMYLIEQLCMDRKALEQSIPSSTSQTTLALKDPLLIELKQVLKKIMQNFQTRAEISQEIKTIEKTDDIGPRLTKNAIEKTPLDDESLFALQFEIYDDQKKKILGMEKEQKQLLEKVVELNQKFMNSRQTNDMIRQRESALSNLEQAYRHFIDVETNLQEGIKFFAELENVLMGLKGQVLDYVRNRNLDRDHILMSIKNKSAYPLPPVQQMGNMQLGQPGIWNPHQSQGQSVQHGQVYQSQSQYNQYQGYQGQNQYAPQLQQFAQPQYGVWQPPQASQNPGIYNPSTPGAYPSQPGPPTYDQNRRK